MSSAANQVAGKMAEAAAVAATDAVTELERQFMAHQQMHDRTVERLKAVEAERDALKADLAALKQTLTPEPGGDAGAGEGESEAEGGGG